MDYSANKTLKCSSVEIVGQISNGLAHETRNSLQKIQSALNIFSRQFGEDKKVLEIIKKIESSADNIALQFDKLR